MKVLFVASECAPFVKTGGLADVIGAVPKALARLGVSVRVLLPAYPAFAEFLRNGEVVQRFDDLFGGNAELVSVTAHGLDLLLLNAPHLFDRAGNIYIDAEGQDWHDNHLRFGALSRVGAEVAEQGIGEWQPDLVNIHDWQAGMLPAYMNRSAENRPAVIMTVHNIAFQGLFDKRLLGELGLDASLFTPDGIEFYDKIGFLKAGLMMADKITTVSQTYAQELLLPEFGMGLDGLLTLRQPDLTGILNGIDLDVWNPATDPALKSSYTANSIERKQDNRALIESTFNLTPVQDSPLFCVVSRLTTQKGLDLLVDCVPALVKRGARLAVLGTGEASLERAFTEAATQFSGSVGVRIGFDETLSHRLQGGSDAIIIPSRFEPCGLTQLCGLRYGTLPIVARTGGLADTVIHANDAALASRCATGVQFSPITAETLNAAIGRACSLFQDTDTWSTMVRSAMEQPVGWDRSAQRYLKLYKQLATNSIE